MSDAELSNVLVGSVNTRPEKSAAELAVKIQAVLVGTVGEHSSGDR